MVQLTDVISDFWQAAQRGERSPLAWSGRLSNEEGYRVQLGIADHYQASGTNRVGWKVAATNKVVQAQLGVSEPAFGSLRDKDVLWSGGVLAIGNLAQAHVECELCFRVNEKIETARSVADIRAALDVVYPAFEFIEKRIPMTELALAIADNVEHTGIVLGKPMKLEQDIDFRSVVCTLTRGDEEISSANGEAVLGDPLNSILWLKQALEQYDRALVKGDLIMTGSFVRQLPLVPGDRVRAEFTGIGSVELNIVQ